MKKQNKTNTAIKKITFGKNILLICLSYFFMGINFILSAAIKNKPFDSSAKCAILLGIIFLCMVPISYFDTRESMQGRFNAIACCITYFLSSLFVLYIDFLVWHIKLSWVILLLFAAEVVVLASIFISKLKN